MKRRLISLLLALALIITCLPQLTLPTWAATSGTCGDNLTWSFNKSTGKLTITGKGQMKNYYAEENQSPWHGFGNEITDIALPDGITSIGQYAFHACQKLTSITIPGSVKRIELGAFCICERLKDVTLQNGLEYIGVDAFIGCKALTEILIPDSVQNISDKAFMNCSELKNVYYTGSKTKWGKITIGDFNDPLLNATIHYDSEGDETTCQHIWDSFVVIIQPTCTESGSKTRTCKVCGAAENEILDPLGHNYVDGVCTRCGAKEDGDGNTNPGGSVTCKDGHSWEIDDPDQFQCKSCGRVERVSPVLGYSFQKDSFHFINDDVASYEISSLGYSYIRKRLRIDIIACFRFSGSKIAKLINSEGPFHGACFGMSAMNSSFFFGMQASFFGADSVRELNIDSANPAIFNQDTKLKDAINIMHFSQASSPETILNFKEHEIDGAIFSKINNKKMVNIAKEMRCGDYPPLVSFKFKIKRKDYEHCVSVIGIEPDDFNKDYYCITTYDSISPNMPSLLYVKKDYSDVTYKRYFEEENKMKEYKVIEISNFITSSKYNIDYWAPGLRTSDRYSINSEKKAKSIESEESESLQTEDQAVIEKLEKSYISFSVAADDEVEIRSSNGKKVIIADSDVSYSDYSETYRLPFVGTSMTRVIIPYDAGEYTLTCDGEVAAYINYNHNIATAYLDSGGTVKYSAAGKVCYCPRAAGAYSEGAYYRAGLIHESDIIGCGTQGNIDSTITIDCSSGDVLLTGKDIASQELFIQHDNYEMTVDSLAFDKNQTCNSIVVDSPDGKQVQVKYNQSDKSSSFLFDDVKNEKAFYYDAVYWAYNAEPQITNGIDKTHFGPDRGCTRGQVVTFLWRAAGCPAPKSTKTKFKDVGERAFYAKAVAWAVEKGITKGMSETSFAPDATCTRGQIVTFLWRFRNQEEPKSTKTAFTDVSDKAFYAKAVAWAVENKVTNGMTAITFAPDATCTRGQIVTFLYRAKKE